jgi:hypothetical protein
MAIATRAGGPISPPPPSRREHWQALLEAQRRSGLTLAAFCRRRGLRKGSLSFWKWKLAHERAPGTGRKVEAAGRTPPAAFVPIQIPVPRVGEPEALADARADQGELEIVLADGRHLRVRGRLDAAWLAAVVHAVEARGC